MKSIYNYSNVFIFSFFIKDDKNKAIQLKLIASIIKQLIMKQIKHIFFYIKEIYSKDNDALNIFILFLNKLLLKSFP